MTRRMMTRRIATRAVENEGGDVAESTEAVLFAYDAVVDATVEMTRISHAVAAARWPENVPGDASSYVEAMRAAKIREPERSATREILGETPPVGVAEKMAEGAHMTYELAVVVADAASAAAWVSPGG